MPGKSIKTGCFVLAGFLFSPLLFAHNGSIGYAYPLGKIKVDGDLSDWPRTGEKYAIGMHLSDTKPVNAADFSGFFQVGYRLDDRSLYLAFSITDDDFIEDTSSNVRWNTQDGLELSVDARHLVTGSGVASFMYSKKLRNVNRASFDVFAKNAGWEIMEVAMKISGTTRYYEWRILLGNQLAVGKTIGIDFNVFDKDSDESFSFSSWGRGASKYMNPNSLCDVMILPAAAKLATITGNVGWDAPSTAHLPGEVKLVSEKNAGLWVEAMLDSMGNYSVRLPAGKYVVSLPEAYFQNGGTIYSSGNSKAIVFAVSGQKTVAPRLIIPSAPAPDLVPDKGILPGFNAATPAIVDNFVRTYQAYYRIPGVSLALVKDGKLIYHKTYGVSNAVSGEKVTNLTLFEAASITKPVFAFAVQRLAERGIIDLDKPLYRYLPYEDIAYDDRYKLITARHVLTHRTGFPNWRYMNDDGKLDLKFTPGTGYGYSGEGFEYLKMVVEKITGKKVEQVLQEEVIEPMGLYHTFFSSNDSLKRLVSYGHHNGLPTNNDPPDAPGMAYSMHTEAAVFTRFMLYLLEQKGLKPETYDTMFSRQSEFNVDPGEERPKNPEYMGMSLAIRETPFGKTFGHGGNNGDFKCLFEVYMESKMGYAIFTNSGDADVLIENMRKLLVEGKEKP